MGELRVRLDELLPTKEAQRSLPRQLGRLERGEVDHLVLTRRNQPCAVLLTVERYEQLAEQEGNRGAAE